MHYHCMYQELECIAGVRRWTVQYSVPTTSNMSTYYKNHCLTLSFSLMFSPVTPTRPKTTSSLYVESLQHSRSRRFLRIVNSLISCGWVALYVFYARRFSALARRSSQNRHAESNAETLTSAPFTCDSIRHLPTAHHKLRKPCTHSRFSIPLCLAHLLITLDMRPP